MEVILILLLVAALVILPIMAIVAYVRSAKIGGLQKRIEWLESALQNQQFRQEEIARQLGGAAADPIAKDESKALVPEDLAKEDLALGDLALGDLVEQRPPETVTADIVPPVQLVPELPEPSEPRVGTRCPSCGLMLGELKSDSCPGCGYDLVEKPASQIAAEPVPATSGDEAEQPELAATVPMGPDLETEPWAPEPIAPLPPPRPSWSQRLARHLTTEEFETIFGASWLNKIGVLVLIIGIALFIAYSIANLGALGRIAVGYVVSAVLLTIGVIGERRSKYRTFARGLLAGGWAGSYFTTFAAYSIEASKIIHDPVLATSLLIAVAAGMIAHSLYYQSQQITSLAYVFAFFAIVVSPITTFSNIASVPLILSLAFVSFHWKWIEIAVFGVVSAYGIALFRNMIDATVSPLFVNQAILACYWLIFEILDLMFLFKRTTDLRREAILLLNATGFLGVSAMLWANLDPDNLFVFLAGSAIVFLISALVRARIRPPSAYRDVADPLQQVLAGGYEISVTLSAALFAFAIFQRLEGLQISFALLLEAQCLFLIGLKLRQKFLQAIAAVILHVQPCTLISVIAQQNQLVVGGVTLFDWTPAALITGLVLYLNRRLVGRHPAKRGLGMELLYGVIATVLFCVVAFHELPPEIFAFSIVAYSLILFEVGYRLALIEFRGQGYVVGAAGLVWLLVVNGFQFTVPEATSGQIRWWIWLLPAMAICYACAYRFYGGRGDRLPAGERVYLDHCCLVIGSLLYGLLIWYVLPVPLVALGWSAGGLVLLQLGRAQSDSLFRLNGHVLILAGVVWLFFANFTNPGTTAWLSHRLLTVAPMALLLYNVASALNSAVDRKSQRPWERNLPRIYLWLGSLLVVMLMRFELGRVLAVFGWALLMVALLWIGLHRNVRDLRWQSYLIAIISFARSWATNFVMPASLAGIFGRVLTGAVVIVCYVVAQFISPRKPSVDDTGGKNWLTRSLAAFDSHARWLFCVLGVALLAVLLSYEMPGRLATLAWGLEAFSLVLIGFLIAESPFFVCGLAMLAVCLVRMFFDESLGLDATYRIASYASVIGGYFLAHFLTPKVALSASSFPSRWVEKAIEMVSFHSRWLFCLTGTVLMTFLIAYEVSGRVLTVGWGVQGTALLVLGFIIRDRTFRYCGLGLLTICVLKLFVFDLRGLDTPYRIASFVLLGILMIVVSWIYTRYRDQIRQHI